MDFWGKPNVLIDQLCEVGRSICLKAQKLKLEVAFSYGYAATGCYGSKKGTKIKGKIDENLRSLGVFFLTHSHMATKGGQKSQCYLRLVQVFFSVGLSRGATPEVGRVGIPSIEEFEESIFVDQNHQNSDELAHEGDQERKSCRCS